MPGGWLKEKAACACLNTTSTLAQLTPPPSFPPSPSSFLSLFVSARPSTFTQLPPLSFPPLSLARPLPRSYVEDAFTSAAEELGGAFNVDEALFERELRDAEVNKEAEG